MIPELDDEKRILFDLIDEPVFFVYSSGPITKEGMPKRLWFSFSLIRCSAISLMRSFILLRTRLSVRCQKR